MDTRAHKQWHDVFLSIIIELIANHVLPAMHYGFGKFIASREICAVRSGLKYPSAIRLGSGSWGVLPLELGEKSMAGLTG